MRLNRNRARYMRKQTDRRTEKCMERHETKHKQRRTKTDKYIFYTHIGTDTQTHTFPIHRQYKNTQTHGHTHLPNPSPVSSPIKRVQPARRIGSSCDGRLDTKQTPLAGEALSKAAPRQRDRGIGCPVSTEGRCHDG